MNRDLKSICYAFIAQDIEVYTPEDRQNCFLICHLVCEECGAFWHTSLLECYFCGELNYYIYTCTGCGKIYSITNASIKCDCKIEGAKLIKKCINPSCISNNDDEISELTKKKKGVFERDSSFNLSLMHCVSCGGLRNYYKENLVFLINLDEKTNYQEFIDSNSIEKGSVIIFKKHYNNKILYDFVIYSPNKSIKLNWEYSKISEIINKLFPQKN